MPEMVNFENLKLLVKQCYQTVEIGQKLLENAQIYHIQCDILSHFPTICYLMYVYYRVSKRVLISCQFLHYY